MKATYKQYIALLVILLLFAGLLAALPDGPVHSPPHPTAHHSKIQLSG